MSGAVRTSPGKTNTTLGILAGGLATRLGGADKAWLRRDGVPQVLRCQHAYGNLTCATLVSANRGFERYLEHGLRVVCDAGASGRGPISGMRALAEACDSEWLLTLPADLVEFDPRVAVRMMDEAADDGAFAADADGVQPLVALWSTPSLRSRLQVRPEPTGAIHLLQTGLAMRRVEFPQMRFGNLNTPDDLRVAGIRLQDFDEP